VFQNVIISQQLAGKLVLSTRVGIIRCFRYYWLC